MVELLKEVEVKFELIIVCLLHLQAYLTHQLLQ